MIFFIFTKVVESFQIIDSNSAHDIISIFYINNDYVEMLND